MQEAPAEDCCTSDACEKTAASAPSSPPEVPLHLKEDAELLQLAPNAGDTIVPLTGVIHWDVPHIRQSVRGSLLMSLSVRLHRAVLRPAGQPKLSAGSAGGSVHAGAAAAPLTHLQSLCFTFLIIITTRLLTGS